MDGTTITPVGSLKNALSVVQFLFLGAVFINFVLSGARVGGNI